MSLNKRIKYRLALDLGSTSLGWAIFRLDQHNTPTAIIKAGVRIFSDGRNPKDGSSLAVTRRAARAMRRRRDRLLRRKARMVNKLVEHGFFPADPAERKALELKNPYELRAKGVQEALTPGEFGRVVFHLNQRRGFKSNRKTDNGESDAGALKSAIVHLRDDIKAQGLQTVGELLWQRMQAGKGTRARYREARVPRGDGKTRIEKSYDLYIDRQMIADEFDALWRKQASLNPVLFTDAARDDLRDTLLYQRKLRPVKPGRCTLLPELERAPLALPSTQRFRILQEVNHLRVLRLDAPEEPLPLTQRDTIAALLEKKEKVMFIDMRKALGLGGSEKFNLEDEKRKFLEGNGTSVTLSKKDRFGAAWHSFEAALQDEIVMRVLTEESEEVLVKWLCDTTGVEEVRAERIANTQLDDRYGSLSRKALARIVPALRAEVVTYDKAVQAAGFAHHSDLGFGFEHGSDEVEQVGERIIKSTGEIQPVFAFKQLPYYGKPLKRHVAFGSGKPQDPDEKRYGKIANPTVHIGLNQVRKVVNALIHRYGRPTEIVVELARELKQSRDQKLETQKRQAENQKRNEQIRQDISDAYQQQGIKLASEHVKRTDIEKWILWKELNEKNAADRCCPYSGKPINAHMLLNNEVEIEHILPFSQTLDDSLNNKTISIRKANRIKRNRTPWQAREDFEAQGWAYEDILLRAEHMPKAKRYRFAADGYERWLGEDKGFLARALNDTKYLSRIAKDYLKLVCPGGVRVIPGQLTGMLRWHLGLNDVLGLDGEKNRNDHRHHAVDACVIGVTDQALLQRFASASELPKEQGRHKLAQDFEPPWPTYREHVARAISAIWVSHRPDHGHEGSMMEETSYGIRKDGRIKQRHKADGSPGREVSNLIRISEATQPERHGVDAEGNPLPYKGYIGGSNYCIEITRNDKGKWEGDVISTFRAYEIARKHGVDQLKNPERTQNDKPLVMRLTNGDLLKLELDEGRLKVMRVVSINSAGRLTLAEHHEANVDARNKNADEAYAYSYKMSGSLQKAKARRITISPIGEMRDPGFKD